MAPRPMPTPALTAPAGFVLQLTTLTAGSRHVITGTTARELVLAMRDTQWSAPDHKREYMTQVADRVAAMFGATIGTDTPTMFLRDLVAARLIRVETLPVS